LTQLFDLNDYIDIPPGSSIYLASGSLTTSFYTVWPLKQFPSDFNYSFPGANSITDQENPIANLNDLYEATMSMRIMIQNGSNVSYEMSYNAVIYWKTNMLKIQYDHSVKGLRVNDLTPELGIISFFSYLLLAYVNFTFIAESGFWPTSSDAYNIINDSFYTNLVLAIVDSGFTTDASLYFPLQFIDFYNYTIPNIDYMSEQQIAMYHSRFGEALGYLWASYVIRGSNGQGGPPQDLLTAIYSVVAQSVPYLLRGECGSSTQIFPLLPWNGLYSTSAFGFQLDPAAVSTMGDSPDAVFIQSFLPFSPTSNQAITPFLVQYSLSCMKILKCNLLNGYIDYYFGGYVDPSWVGYFLYLFDPLDRTSTIVNGTLDDSLRVFIQTVSIEYRLPALLMNYVKLNDSAPFPY
jgi:hypothetical protein